jgi:hypothetical protein
VSDQASLLVGQERGRLSAHEEFAGHVPAVVNLAREHDGGRAGVDHQLKGARVAPSFLQSLARPLLDHDGAQNLNERLLLEAAARHVAVVARHAQPIGIVDDESRWGACASFGGQRPSKDRALAPTASSDFIGIERHCRGYRFANQVKLRSGRAARAAARRKVPRIRVREADPPGCDAGLRPSLRVLVLEPPGAAAQYGLRSGSRLEMDRTIKDFDDHERPRHITAARRAASAEQKAALRALLAAAAQRTRG